LGRRPFLQLILVLRITFSPRERQWFDDNSSATATVLSLASSSRLEFPFLALERSPQRRAVNSIYLCRRSFEDWRDRDEVDSRHGFRKNGPDERVRPYLSTRSLTPYFHRTVGFYGSRFMSEKGKNLGKPRFPHLSTPAKRCYRGSAKPRCSGSNPLAASSFLVSTEMTSTLATIE
jgi:hypothetical protein